MNPDRSFSFSRNDDSHHNSSYRGAGGYRVASTASYVPAPPGHRNQSPVSSLHSSSSERSLNGPPDMVALDSYEQYRQQARHGDEQQRMSAYRKQRQETATPANYPSRSQPRKPLPVVPQANVSLGGNPHNIPMPPPHTRSATSLNPQMYDEEQAYTPSGPFEARERSGPSRERNGSYSSSQGYASHQPSHSSQLGQAAAAATPALLDIDRYDTGRASPYSPQNQLYSGSVEKVYRHSMGDPRQGMGSIDPTSIDDDDDDPFASVSRNKGKSSYLGAGPTAAGTAATAGAAGNGRSSFLKGLGSRDSSGSYGQVPGGGGGGGGEKKSDWLKRQTSGNKRLKWTVAILIVVVIVLAIIGGVVGAVLTKHSSDSTTSSIPQTGELTSSSPEIAALMNNPKLHKVFPGMDYNAPYNAQYPYCLTDPPSQNNITADIAILSQLTPVIRLYGTDCEQPQMVLNAIKHLGLQDSMRVWGGIYFDGNQTTNARQMRQMFEVLDKYGADQFDGIIVGNEVLYGEYMTSTELISKMNEVRAKLRKRGMGSLKVATGDLGSNWDATLAQASDVLMANVHPFFGGVAASQAAAWTYEYWQNNDVSLIRGLPGKSSIIAETGWPSTGGNRCTTPTGTTIRCSSDTQGAVAGIDEMNTFLKNWVCSSLEKGTEYFWFEAFDEPWKVMYDTKNEHWESKWGLFDANRNLKDGVEIPDCGGRRATLRRR